MVLNNVSKFHKILIKSIRLREGTSFGQTYGRTGVTLNAQAIVMAGGIIIKVGHFKYRIYSNVSLENA